jgi:hypothetical protein
MAAVAGLRGTGDWGTDERPKNFRELIMFRNPNGSAPIFALTSKIAEEAVNDPEFAWWDEPNDLIRLQVNGGLNSTATALVVNSPDPDATDPGLLYGLATHLKPGDLLLVEPVLGAEVAASWQAEIVQVTAVASATALTISRGAAGSTAAAIANAGFLTKIGSAYAEGTASPNAVSRNPIKYSNLCQIFKTSYEVTGTADETYARTGNVRANDKKRKIFDHARDIELSILLGQKFETTGANGKPLRFMGGLRDFIPPSNTTAFGANVTLDQYLAAVAPCFNFDTPAGDERILFCGNGYANTLNLLANAGGNIQFGETIKAYGMELREFILPQGRLLIRRHPLMSRHPFYTYSAFGVDFASLKYRYLRDTRSEDEIQANDSDTHKGQWLSEISIEVQRGGLTQFYHGNFASVA